jgi:hypothetical protein
MGLIVVYKDVEDLVFRRLLFKGKLQFAFKQQSPDKSTVEKQHKDLVFRYLRDIPIWIKYSVCCVIDP